MDHGNFPTERCCFRALVAKMVDNPHLSMVTSWVAKRYFVYAFNDYMQSYTPE